ncbi:DUF1449 family protein [Candidatus Poribacteria bacterium]|nr:DUF1449 family protein [Candidatus Poribacteria bacterium]
MKAFLMYFLASYNICFTIPLVIAVLWVFFRLVKGPMGFSETDVAAKGQRSSLIGILGFLKAKCCRLKAKCCRLNVGRVPLAVVLISLFVAWGIVGLIANSGLDVSEKPQRIWITCILALFFSLLSARYISIAFLKFFPQREKIVSDDELLGLSGRVISGQITTTFGTARLRVPDGPELTVSCRAKSDETPPVKGDTVILVNYDDAKRIFDVRKAELMDAD